MKEKFGYFAVKQAAPDNEEAKSLGIDAKSQDTGNEAIRKEKKDNGKAMRNAALLTALGLGAGAAGYAATEDGRKKYKMLIDKLKAGHQYTVDQVAKAIDAINKAKAPTWSETIRSASKPALIGALASGGALWGINSRMPDIGDFEQILAKHKSTDPKTHVDFLEHGNTAEVMDHGRRRTVPTWDIDPHTGRYTVRAATNMEAFENALNAAKNGRPAPVSGASRLAKLKYRGGKLLDLITARRMRELHALSDMNHVKGWLQQAGVNKRFSLAGHKKQRVGISSIPLLISALVAGDRVRRDVRKRRGGN